MFWHKQQVQNLHKQIGRMNKIILLFHLWIQHMIQIKGLPALNPFRVIGVDQKTYWHMWLWVLFLRSSMKVRKSATLVKGPAFNMTSMMELIKDLEPVLQVRVSPLGFGDCICSLMCVWVNKRFIHRHPIISQWLFLPVGGPSFCGETSGSWFSW